MTSKELAVIEAKRERVQAERESILPNKSDLAEKRADLVTKHSGLLVDRAMNGGANLDRQIEATSKGIADIDQKLKDLDNLVEGLVQVDTDLRTQENACKLGIETARYKELAPQTGKLVKKYLQLRKQIAEVSGEYNQVAGEVGRLRTVIQERRRDLGVGAADCDDLPGVCRLNYNDQHEGIRPSQLRGEKKW